jgi:putative membrane protein
MLRALALRTVALAAGFAVIDWTMDTVTVTGGVLRTLWVAFLYGLVSAVIGTLLRLLTLPLLVLTLGLFAFVVNAVLLMITDWLSDALDIESFLTALGAAVILAVVSLVVEFLVARVLWRD